MCRNGCIAAPAGTADAALEVVQLVELGPRLWVELGLHPVLAHQQDALGQHLELEVQAQVAEHVGHDLAAEMAAQRLQVLSEVRAAEVLGVDQLEQARIGVEVRAQPVADRAFAAPEDVPRSGGSTSRMPRSKAPAGRESG